MSDTTSAPAFFLERIIRQTDRSQQFGTLGKIAAHGGILGIHGIAGGHKSHQHTAGTHLIQCFGRKSNYEC